MKKFMLTCCLFLFSTMSYAIDSVEYIKTCKTSAAGKLAVMQGFPYYCTYQYITRASINGSDTIENINRVFDIVYDALSKLTPEEFDNRLAAYIKFDKGIVKDPQLLPAYCEVILYKMEEKKNPNISNLDPDMLGTEHNKKCQELINRP